MAPRHRGPHRPQPLGAVARAGREHREPVRQPRQERLRESTLMRAAASSMASGNPSRRRQTAGAGAALASVSAKLGETARARSTKNATAEASATAAGEAGERGSGSSSG